MATLVTVDKTKVFRAPIVPAEVAVQETASTSFADLVRLMAEGIADAQMALDRSAAEMVAELAETTVQIIPSVTEVVAADGTVTFTQGAAQTVSLLALGVKPTFYQFSQATVEVTMDLKLVEQLNSDGTVKKGGLGLFAETSNLRFERKLNRDVSVHSKITATLVPVPAPLRLEIPRRTVTS
jgi:hypothetical protein